MSLRQMRRRTFGAALGGAATWWLAARAQVLPKRPVIAFMSLVARERNLALMDAFMQGLRRLNAVEGRDFELVLRSADGRLDRVSSLAREVIDLRPDVILATATPGVVV